MEKSVYQMAKKCAVLVLLNLLILNAWGQGISSGRMNVSQMSSQEILMLWQQAQKGGLSESDAIKQLTRSGMSANDVNVFKRKLLQAQGGLKPNTKGLVTDTARFLQDSSWYQSIPQMKKMSPYYGFDFFSNPDVTFDASLNIAPPRNYKLGPGDMLTISLTGVNETNVSDKISKEGYFQVPYVGMVSLSGLTIDQARERLIAKMKPAYPALATGRTQLFLTIDNTRSISVYIVGEAARPGKFTVSALASFFNVLYLSGGKCIIC